MTEKAAEIAGGSGVRAWDPLRALVETARRLGDRHSPPVGLHAVRLGFRPGTNGGHSHYAGLGIEVSMRPRKGAEDNRRRTGFPARLSNLN